MEANPHVDEAEFGAWREGLEALRPLPDPPGLTRRLVVCVTSAIGNDVKWSLPGAGMYRRHLVQLYGLYIAIAACLLAHNTDRRTAGQALRRLADRLERDGPTAVREALDRDGEA